jgi:hypothetical protein
MHPTERQLDRPIRARFDQLPIPGIAIDLQDALECRQMRDRVFTMATIAVDIGHGRMRGSGPRPVVHRVAPELPGLGFSPAGIEHRQCRLVGEYLVR